MPISKKSRKHKTLHGIGVSPGVAKGPAYLLFARWANIQERRIGKDEIDLEISRFEDSIIETRRQIKNIKAELEEKTRQKDASIIDAHLMVLDDRTLMEEIIDEIKSKEINSEAVVWRVAQKYSEALGSLKDSYLSARVIDIKDVGRRIIMNLMGNKSSPIESFSAGHVIIAEDLTPSETAVLNRDKVLGFATEFGSPSAHTAVLARALQIPAIVALRNVTKEVSVGDEVLIDGNKGVMIINPTSVQLKKYGHVQEIRLSIQKDLEELRNKKAQTTDGKKIVLSANIESPDEVKVVKEYGADGIGLFRSEYLFMLKDRFIDEEEQAESYSAVAKGLAPSSVIIRTLDMGGDKWFPGKQGRKEANPFLGCRSIRLSLANPDLFKTQLRAILRASVSGNIKIMYPMISGESEVEAANEILNEAKKELDKEGVPFDRKIQVGVMIEVPSAVLVAELIGEHVDFFSIGTNDLIQYTMAVDRTNENVAYLYDPTNPAILRMLKQTIDAAHKCGIWAGICGEMAADPVITPLLVGLGIDELSVAPSAVPLVKDAIRSLKFRETESLAKSAMECRSSMEVLYQCRKMIKQAAPELMELI